MTTADSAWEVDLPNSFKLYRNLTANVLLAYLVTDYDEEIRTAKYGNAFRCTFNLNYVFLLSRAGMRTGRAVAAGSAGQESLRKPESRGYGYPQVSGFLFL